jgi:hypothetical protein
MNGIKRSKLHKILTQKALKAGAVIQ